MDINKAIEFLRSIKGFVVHYSYDKKDEKLDKVIELLEEGEKYKKMWGEFEKEYGYYPIKESHRNFFNIRNIMTFIKQKYFPKPKDETIKLIIEINKEVKKLLNILERR